MIIIEEYEECDRNDIVLIKSQTYYKLEFLTNDWILRRLYIIENYNEYLSFTVNMDSKKIRKIIEKIKNIKNEGQTSKNNLKYNKKRNRKFVSKR